MSSSPQLAGVTLYQLPGCLFCWRVRFAAWRLGITLPMKNLLRDPAAHRQLAVEGGKMQVPCLRIEGPEGVRWLYESADIIDWLRGWQDAMR
ncbi:MAG: glutathione S-transferase N-terminal domain-containing protein [Gammaproteobacteria bacterium]|nr:glutathione S-transferase N-terminal domain-containing protein [Gammaproteobacteria bacterium]